MVERYATNRQTLILIHHLAFCCVDGMKHHLVFQSLTEHFHLGLQHRSELSRGVHMERTGASQHAEGGDQAHEPEAMVAMEV